MFGEIRTMTDEQGETWFVGKDVAEALGYSKSRNALFAHVEGEDKKDALIQGPLGGPQKMTVINESGLYALVLSSKLPQAKAFKRWVTSEVLPQIRRTGGYIPTKDGQGRDLTDMEIVCLALKIQQKTIDEQHKRIGERGNKLYFFKKELVEWIQSGGAYDKPYTLSEQEQAEFDAHLEELREKKRHKPSSLKKSADVQSANH